AALKALTKSSAVTRIAFSSAALSIFAAAVSVLAVSVLAVSVLAVSVLAVSVLDCAAASVSPTLLWPMTWPDEKVSRKSDGKKIAARAGTLVFKEMLLLCRG